MFCFTFGPRNTLDLLAEHPYDTGSSRSQLGKAVKEQCREVEKASHSGTERKAPTNPQEVARGEKERH